MVQGGERCTSSSVLDCASRASSSRKAGFEAIQKKTEEKKMEDQKKSQYGSWGPVYKNKQNFINMHIC
ncbi:hypothetical protein C0J52_12693 [Blattella germanica]|nr:hypothetical protein C0J52_12693 [Blattella germanica]